MKTKLINFLYVSSSQALVLLLSILMTLVLPQITSKEDFGYWQFFLLLISFSGFFTLGFNDGYYLIYGGNKYENLPFRRISAKIYIFIFLQFIFSFIIFCSAFFVEEGKTKIFQIAAVYLFFQNITNLLGFIFQGGMRFKTYSFSVLIDKIFFIILFLLIIIGEGKRYELFIISYTVSKGIALIYSVVKAKDFFILTIRELFVEVKQSMREVCSISLVGSSIMISNILGALIIGAGRFIIEDKWGISVFSEVSLSFSLSLFLLMFISQISMIFFPMIKMANREKTKFFFQDGKIVMSLILPLILPINIFISYFIPIWLPEYSKSIEYLVVLLPICIFEGKFQIVYSTFYKALRLEKKILLVNLFSLILSLLLAFGSAYLFDSIYGVMISVLIAIIFRTIVSDGIIGNKLGVTNYSDIIKEILLTLVFLISYLGIEDPVLGNVIFGLSLIVFYVTRKKDFEYIIAKYKK